MRQTDYLLPIGFYDLIGEEAKNNEKNYSNNQRFI